MTNLFPCGKELCNSRFPCRDFLLYLECNYDVIDELHI